MLNAFKTFKKGFKKDLKGLYIAFFKMPWPKPFERPRPIAWPGPWQEPWPKPLPRHWLGPSIPLKALLRTFKGLSRLS